jgi:hypothetical protein
MFRRLDSTVLPFSDAGPVPAGSVAGEYASLAGDDQRNAIARRGVP